MDNIQYLRETLTLTQVAELYQINLHKPEGRQPCPFCGNSTAFKVTRNTYYVCYRCNAKGTIFDLLIDAKVAPDFRGAVKLLAPRAKGAIAQRIAEESKMSTLWSALQSQTIVFRHVIDAFLKKRGYSQLTRAEIGYFPTKEEAPTFLKGLDLPSDWLKERSLTYFEGRICFAVRNSYGAIVHLTGRAVDPDKEPRWLHTKGSPAINNYLYNLHRLREYDTDYAILCEGVSDCHSLLELGEPAIACFGVNLPLVQHVRSLEHLTHLVAFLDRDKYPLGHPRAGEYKSWSGMVPSLIDLSIELKIPIFCCMVPNRSGVKDLNDFVLDLEYDADEFKRYLSNEAVTLHEFAYEMYHRDIKQHELLWRLYRSVPDEDAVSKLRGLVMNRYKDWSDYLMEVIV